MLMVQSKIMLLSLSLCKMIILRSFKQDGTKFYCPCQKIPSDDILESLYKLRIRESSQVKTLLELYEMEIHQKISLPDCQKLKTMVKRRKEKIRNFDHETFTLGKGELNQEQWSRIERD